jgi:MoaA/NifB/PqqE/SkfB family radical SAM enzyme
MSKLILKGSALYLNNEQKLGEKETDYMMLNLPFLCNYNCLKCCNRYRKYKGGLLKLDEIKKAILKCKKLGVRVVVIAGEGEPTLDKNIKKLIQFINNNKLIPYIFTNGSNLNKETATLLAKNNTTLVINIDSSDENKYDKYVQRKGAFKNLMKNISVTKKIYKNKIYYSGKDKITSLAINLVLNNDNYDQIPKIKEFCNDDMVFVVNQPIHIGSASMDWERFNKTKNFNIGKDVSYPLGTVREGKECSYMRDGISIGSNGKILACAYALETEGFYGDINDDIKLEHERVMKSVDNFYKQYGKSRCILRHPKYQKFLKINQDGIKK